MYYNGIQYVAKSYNTERIIIIIMKINCKFHNIKLSYIVSCPSCRPLPILPIKTSAIISYIVPANNNIIIIIVVNTF